MRWLIIIATFFCGQLTAQQLPVYSGFVHNPYLINPAVTGYDMFMDISLHGKKQWAGFNDGPFNQSLTMHSSINEKNYGFGGGFFNDNLGVIKNYGFLTSFGYHLPVGDEAKLGFGVTGRFSFYNLQHDKIVVTHTGDELLTTRQNSGLIPDVSFGMMLHRGDYMIGVSAQNLLATEVGYGNSFGMNNITHYNFMALWRTQLNDNFGFTPAAYIGYIESFPLFMDFRIITHYKNKFDFEVGFKSNMDAVLGVGMEIIENLRLNYNYDLVLSGLRAGIHGSHEVILSYDFYYDPMYKGSKRRYKWINKAPKPKLDTPD